MNGHANGKDRPPHKLGQDDLTMVAKGVNGIYTNGHIDSIDTTPKPSPPFQPVAICGTACRLPGGIHSPSELWAFLHAGRSHPPATTSPPSIRRTRSPPQIKSLPLSPSIDANLIVSTEPTPWPEDRDERVSVSSFGLGGSNAHAIIESAARFNATRKFETSRAVAAPNTPHLLLFSANTPPSLTAIVDKYEGFLNKTLDLLSDVAYTLANKREHLQYRSFAVCTSDNITLASTAPPTKVEQTQEISLIMTLPLIPREELADETLTTRPERSLGM
ncbi:hypothetical protein MauCBS54593_002846 [Microsporum audouinii]